MQNILGRAKSMQIDKNQKICIIQYKYIYKRTHRIFPNALLMKMTKHRS